MLLLAGVALGLGAAALDAGPTGQPIRMAVRSDADQAPPNATGTAAGVVVWAIDNTRSIGGQPAKLTGAPQLVETPAGPAVCFDGSGDQLVLPVNPLAGLTQFTIELLLRPAGHGPREQRLLHMQADGGEENRALIETRVAGATWYLDSFLKSGPARLTLASPSILHATDQWYWVAVTYDGASMRHFVNAVEEESGAIALAPLGPGRTSLGMRLNGVSPFKGCIRELRVHPQALPAARLATAAPAGSPRRAEVLEAMRRATAFMVDRVSCEGGYVWSYLPDLSRRWGEIEAWPTMIWLQAPGTPTMGHLLLDAWHATGDEYYYSAAERVAAALVRAQHPSGGWNYVHDFAGEASLRKWYGTVGRNAWRLEEFQHYYGNATFDDSVTADATRFLLRLHAARRDERHRPALDRAIGFILASQQPSGAWPQRWPPAAEFSKQGLPDYTPLPTLNDDVVAENIDTLLLCYRALGGERLLAAIRGGMDSYLALQQPAPQAGWAMQYTPDLRPAGARTYEPRALATHTTARSVDQFLRFYRWTGEARFLARVPEALAWLESCRLPPSLAREGREFPTFVEPGTNRPLYLHRTGSNARNGRYFADHDPARTLGHYASLRPIDLAELRARYEQAKALAPAEVVRDSPLLDAAGTVAPPRLFTLRERATSDPNQLEAPDEHPLAARALALMRSLNEAGYWPTRLLMTSNPYRGEGSAQPAAGDFGTALVGDSSDTSPYRAPTAVMGLSVAAYVRNMGVLIRFLEEDGAPR